MNDRQSREMKPLDEVTNALAEHKRTNRARTPIYAERASAERDTIISRSVENQIAALRKAKPKIDWNNLEQVKARALLYLEACAKSQSVPSVMGLAVHGFGVSRQALNEWIKQHPDSETADFIKRVKDCIADSLTDSSLHNSVNPIMAIFQLKNHHEHSDRVEIEPVPHVPVETEFSAEDIRKRYMLDEGTDT